MIAQHVSTHHMTSHCITWHDTTQAITSHQITWAHITSHRIASKQVTSPPWNSRRLVHSKDMVWASRWSVALRTFYRQILSLLYTSFFFWNFRPRLARELLGILQRGLHDNVQYIAVLYIKLLHFRSILFNALKRNSKLKFSTTVDGRNLPQLIVRLSHLFTMFSISKVVQDFFLNSITIPQPWHHDHHPKALFSFQGHLPPLPVCQWLIGVTVVWSQHPASAIANAWADENQNQNSTEKSIQLVNRFLYSRNRGMNPYQNTQRL